mgnify:CR=1 FL=1
MSLMFRISAQPFFAGPGGIQVVVDGFVQHDADAAYFAADIGGTFKIPVGGGIVPPLRCLRFLNSWMA